MCRRHSRHHRAEGRAPGPPAAARRAGLGTAAVGTQDLGAIRQEAPADERGGASIADETLAVPMTVIKRYELCATETSDGSDAATAFLGEEVSKAFSAERFLVLGGELLSSQHLVAVRASEAFAVPWCVLVSNAAFVDDAVALETALRVLLLVAGHTDDLLVTWYETLVSYWL